MKTSDYYIVSKNTGEIFDGDFNITKVNANPDNSVILTKENILDESDEKKKFLHNYLRKIKEINEFGQMRIDGVWVNEKMLELAKENNFEKEIVRLMVQTCTKHNKVKNSVNGRKTAHSWTEFYEFLKVPSNKRKKFREFLVENEIASLRTYDVEGQYNVKDIFVNPLYFKKYSHVGIQSIIAFKKQTLSKVHKYSVYWLYQYGFIEGEDVLE